MPPAWAVDFPRLYELYSDSDTTSNENYFIFINFENNVDRPNVRAVFKQLEEDLQQLDGNAWQGLKQKAVKYVTIKDKRNDKRSRYEQLFDTLSEVKGYLYLRSEGCTEIHFIPEEGTQTPDLYGRHGNSGILMEVKTINRSDDELDWIKANSELRNGRMTPRTVLRVLSDSLKCKIIGKINIAKKQLLSYSCNGIQRKIVYLVIEPDLQVALDSRSVEELVAFLEEQDNDQVEVKHCFRGWRMRAGW